MSETVQANATALLTEVEKVNAVILPEPMAEVVPLEAALLPRALEDTEFSVINGNFALSSGLKLTDAVALEKTPDYYLLVAAVRSADKNTPWANDLAAAFKTPFFRDVLDKHFPGYARPASLR